MIRHLCSLVTAGAIGLLLSLAAPAQMQKQAPSLVVGYQATRSNAGPGDCGCFYLQGGSAQALFPVRGPLSIAADVGGSTTQGAYLGYPLTLVTYTAGPQISHTWRRWVPFAQALVGGAHGSGLPFGNTGSRSANSFALLAGGGMDLRLSHRLMLRLLEADYNLTELPNTASNRQNNLRLGAGIRINLR